ncbi:hypothetical protein [Burkholderia lata]|uniref:hypothetical protein n=1 Tax=Burkholderia lata (strain ATCC 17760 / DSM 23089 / LMG 22485 / NCIMB 9086 / R18194 / 383) TaxID=482957 RepID=UPI001583473A|nr:hypothetical protein [Burkholderia lata]
MTLDELASPTWWGTAVVGAIALKVVADYVRMGLEKVASKAVSAWASRSASSKARFDQRVLAMRSSRLLRDVYQQLEARYRSYAILTLVFAGMIVGMLMTLRVLDALDHLAVLQGATPRFPPDTKYMRILLAATASVLMVASVGCLFQAFAIQRALGAALFGPELDTAPANDRPQENATH